MNRAVLAASWFAVRRAGLLVPAAAALVLLAVTAPVLDDGYAVQVLRGVGVLLACAWVATTDDPSGELLGGSPYPRRVRTLMRATAGGFVVLPTWALAAAVVEVRSAASPVWGLSLEALALAVGGLAIGAGIRAWTVHYAASYLAVIGVVVLAIGTNALPRDWAMVQEQTWGPPWEAAQLRWLALLLLVVAVLALALRDPVQTCSLVRSGSAASGWSALPGISSQKAAPPSADLPARTSPPCRSATCRTMDSPSPEPGRVRESVER